MIAGRSFPIHRVLGMNAYDHEDIPGQTTKSSTGHLHYVMVLPTHHRYQAFGLLQRRINVLPKKGGNYIQLISEANLDYPACRRQRSASIRPGKVNS
jgi:hypothetical protein